MHARMPPTPKRESPGRRFARFGRKHRLATLQTVHLWKNFFTWVKQTQRPWFARLFALTKRNFYRSRETEIAFAICAKTSILSGFLMCLSIRAAARGDVARRRFAQ
jgi:hypothetical protein